MAPPRLGLVASTFVAFGLFWGSWAVAAADVERETHFSHAQLGLYLSGSVAVGGIVAAAAGGAADRHGPSRSLRWSLVVWGLLVVLAGCVPGVGAFEFAFVGAMATAGLVDMTMNSAATNALGGASGRMVQFHALFNAGALLGAALTGALLASHVSWRWAWVAAGSVGLALAGAGAWVARPSRRVGPVDDGQPASDDAWQPQPVVAEAAHGRRLRSATRSLVAIRQEGLVILAVAFAATAVVEGGIDTWGVLYLRTHLATGALVGAGAYAVGQVLACTTRGAGGPLIGRMSPRLGLSLGAGIAAAGLFVESESHDVVVAAIGLALAAGGISFCWPLAMARLGAPSGRADQSRRQRSSTAALVGGFTATGYLGWVAGPALVGWLAEGAGLGAGLVLLASIATAAALAVGAIPGSVGSK